MFVERVRVIEEIKIKVIPLTCNVFLESVQ
jgi:hypothetical protein